MNPHLCKCGRPKPAHIAACFGCCMAAAQEYDRQAVIADGRGDKWKALTARLRAQVCRVEAYRTVPPPVLHEPLFLSMFED